MAASTAIRGGIVLEGYDLEAREADLLLRDGRVAEVGASGDVAADHVVDASGCYVVPGLIDSHVHFGLTASINAFAFWKRPQLDRSLAMYRNGLIALLNGVTTVRDLGAADHGVIRYSQLVEQGDLLGPRVVACGQFIVMTGGHGWDWGREADGPDEVRKAVREQVRAGAGVIKFMATGGMSTPGSVHSPELSAAELAAGVEEAHHAGLKAAAHAHNSAGIANALAAGIDSIEHAAVGRRADFEAMKAAGAILVPTLNAVSHLRPGCGVDEDVVAKVEATREGFHEAVRTALAVGVEIAAGTDAGTSLNPIGRVVDEIEQYRDLGMTDLDALLAATVRAGRLLGRETGAIKEGWAADLLIVESDPRADIQTLRRPREVIARGRRVPLAELREVLAGLPELGPVYGGL